MINKRLVAAVPGSMKWVWLNVAVQWLGLLCNVATVFAVAYVLEATLLHTLSSRMLWMVLAIVTVAVAVRFVCTMASARLGFLASSKVKLLLRDKIYQKLLHLGPSYHQHVSTAEVVQVAVEGVDQLEIYFSKYLPQLFYSLLAPLTLFSILSFISLPSALVLLLCVPLIPLSIVAVQKFAKKLLAKYWGSYTQLGDGFLENLQGLTTLKIYGSDEAKNHEMNDRAEDFRKITMKVLVMQLNSITLMDVIAYGGAALGLIFSINQYLAGNIGFAGCFCIILLAADFFIPLRMLGSFFHIAMNGMAASDKIFRLLDLPQQEEGTPYPLDIEKGLTLQHVSFSYDGQRQVLKDIHLTAGPGLTAVVGKSGCGKSTIAVLVSGQNRGYTGSATLGGVEIAALGTVQLSKTVTMVPHNSYLFKGTVRENLLMGNAAASKARMWDVLKKVRLDDFLKGEKGLDTSLLEAGSNISGGQRQRLALARALLHDTPVYIFDEATSNIDAESENDIAEVIWELGKSKTVLLISHRLANVVPAGRIYMMEEGRIIESGHHQELLSRNGAYAAIYRAQQELEQMGQRLDPTKKEAANG